MKKLAFSLLLLLILAAIIPFTLPLKNGQPLLSWSELSWRDLPTAALPSLPELPAVFTPTPAPPSRSGEVTSYKWQDSSGQWQISDRPPASGRYETVTVNANANLIQGAKSATTAPAAPSAAPVSAKPVAAPVAVGGAVQLLHDAQGVEQQLKERAQTMEQTIQRH